MLFQASVGAWDFSIYDVLSPERQIYGTLYHITFICMNLLLIMNLLIAIMSDTYAKFSELKIGLYIQGIIQAMPVYKYDSKYSFLVTVIPPRNLLLLPLLPIAAFCGGNDRFMRRVNRMVMTVTYTPVAIVTGCLFTIAHVLMIPFAWLKVTH